KSFRRFDFYYYVQIAVTFLLQNFHSVAFKSYLGTRLSAFGNFALSFAFHCVDSNGIAASRIVISYRQIHIQVIAYAPEFVARSHSYGNYEIALSAAVATAITLVADSHSHAVVNACGNIDFYAGFLAHIS